MDDTLEVNADPFPKTWSHCKNLLKPQLWLTVSYDLLEVIDSLVSAL